MTKRKRMKSVQPRASTPLGLHTTKWFFFFFKKNNNKKKQINKQKDTYTVFFFWLITEMEDKQAKGNWYSSTSTLVSKSASRVNCRNP